MKARLAYAHMHGNPAAQRMVSGTDEPYIFPDGSQGTHYMASMDNFAVPQLQYDENGNLIMGDFGPQSSESFMFDSDEDAQAFAEYYKTVAPAMQNFQNGGTVSDIYTRTTGKALTPEYVQYYLKNDDIDYVNRVMKYKKDILSK